jgi:hypothetical protein
MPLKQQHGLKTLTSMDMAVLAALAEYHQPEIP